MKATSIALILITLALRLWGQEYEEPDFQQLIDEIAGTPDLDVPYEMLYDNLVQILSEPYDLNRVSEEELRLLGFLSSQQINSLVEHRASHGEFISVYELQSLPGFDEITSSRLAHFVTVQEPAARMNKSILRRMFENRNMYFLTRYNRTLQRKAGFDAEGKIFQGSPENIYTRFRSSIPGDFSIGLTAEKDAGEPFTWRSARQMGFDYTSFHLQLQNKGRIRNLILGDYQVQAGQGLVLGGLFGLGKGGGETVSTLRRSNLGGLPFTSSNENGYLRGLLFTYRVTPSILITPFYSRVKRDAAVESDSTEALVATSLRLSGLHRTPSEIQGRKVTTETNTGIILNYNSRKLDAGILWNLVSFDIPLMRNLTRYNQFAFRGSQNQNASLFVNYNLHNHAFFTEVAMSVDGGAAMIAGVLTSLNEKLDLGLVFRKYDRNYITFYANALSEGSTVQNETGLYWGWKYRFDKYSHLTGYVDLFRFPWLKFRTYAPSRGYEWLMKFSREITKGTTFYLQVREENKARNVSAETPLYPVRQGLKRNYLAGTSIKASTALTLKTRFQYSTYTIDGKTTGGFVIMQDMALNIGKLKFATRYALFDTDDYDNRQYVYERDAWLSFSLPAYNGVGIRSYIMAGYTFWNHITCWVRFAHTRYTDRENIGSGYDRITGNQRNDIKFQLRYKL